MDVVVVARGRAKEGKEDEVIRAFGEVIPPTHEEEGCVRYALHRSLDDPRTFFMIERWTSKDTLDQHLASAHVGKLFASLSNLLDGPPEIVPLQPLSEATGDKGRI
jgi:quinol monooxygenase YgiN